MTASARAFILVLMLARSSFLLLALSLLLACGDDDPEPSASTTGAGGSSSCTSTQGKLEGLIYRDAEPDPRPGAFALLRQAPGDAPLQVMADDMGHYEVMLEAGTWLVDGQDGDYCQTEQSTSVTITPCGSETVDITTYCVLGGGGSGGML